MKPPLALLALALLLGPVSTFAAERAPAEIVTDIYRIAGGPQGDFQTSGIEDKAVRAKLSRSLAKAMDAMNKRSKATNEPILDFDPITDSQDPTVNDLKIAAEAGDPAHPVVDASFDSGASERHILRYIFVREGKAWKVDDIGGGAGDGKWDLREIITPK